MLLVVCCLFVLPRNDVLQVRMPHQEVIVCFMVFHVSVKGSVMRKNTRRFTCRTESETSLAKSRGISYYRNYYYPTVTLCSCVIARSH